MSKYISELMSPQLMGVVYAFVGFIIALYVPVSYTHLDVYKRQGMYGADAMRYNLLTLCTNNQDVKFDANIDKKTKQLIDLSLIHI